MKTLLIGILATLLSLTSAQAQQTRYYSKVMICGTLAQFHELVKREGLRPLVGAPGSGIKEVNQFGQPVSIEIDIYIMVNQDMKLMVFETPKSADADQVCQLNVGGPVEFDSDKMMDLLDIKKDPDI